MVDVTEAAISGLSSLSAIAEVAASSANIIKTDEPTEAEVAFLTGFMSTPAKVDSSTHSKMDVDAEGGGGGVGADDDDSVMDSVEEESDAADGDYKDGDTPAAATTSSQPQSSKSGARGSRKSTPSSSANSSMPPTPTIGQKGAAVKHEDSTKYVSDRRATRYVSADVFEKFYEEFKLKHYDTHVLRSYTPRSAEVYGEALPAFVEFIISKLKITSRDCFYDIGSGIGNVVVQIAARTGCKAVGVEVRPDLHEIATNLYKDIKANLDKIGKSCGEVQLYCLDATQDTDQIVQFIADSTIIFMNNVCYPAAMQQKLENLFESCASQGTRLVAMKHLFPRGDITHKRTSQGIMSLFKQPWTKVQTPKDMFSWTSNTLTFYIYEVDRTRRFDDESSDWMQQRSRSSRHSQPNQLQQQQQQQQKKKFSTSDNSFGGNSGSNPASNSAPKKKKKKGPPEGERRFRKPKKSTPREPLFETHHTVTSYILPEADPNSVLTKYGQYEPEGWFFPHLLSADEKVLASRRRAKIPAIGRATLTRDDALANFTSNAASLKGFMNKGVVPVLMPEDPKARVLAAAKSDSSVSNNSLFLPAKCLPLPSVHAYVPWAVPPKPVYQPNLVSVSMLNTGLNNSNNTSQQQQQQKDQKSLQQSDAMDVDKPATHDAMDVGDIDAEVESGLQLVAGPCEFESEKWTCSCTKHTSFEQIEQHIKAMFETKRGYYARCLYQWSLREDNKHRDAIFQAIRESALTLIGSSSAGIRQLLASLATRIPADTLLSFLKDIPQDTWVRPFTQPNNNFLLALLARISRDEQSYTEHRAVLISAVVAHFSDIFSKPQARDHLVPLWHACRSHRAERAPLVEKITAHIREIVQDESMLMTMVSLGILRTDDREELTQICRAFASVADLILADEAVAKAIWALFAASDDQSLVAELALDLFACHHLVSFMLSGCNSIVEWLIAHAPAEKAELLASALMTSPDAVAVLNYNANIYFVLGGLLPKLSSEKQQEFKTFLHNQLLQIPIHARAMVEEAVSSPANGGRKKRGRTESDTEGGQVAKKPKPNPEHSDPTEAAQN